jgi:hypothetical protein
LAIIATFFTLHFTAGLAPSFADIFWTPFPHREGASRLPLRTAGILGKRKDARAETRFALSFQLPLSQVNAAIQVIPK